MKREIKLTNQKFAEAFHKHLSDNKVEAVLEKGEKDFTIKYELKADCCAPKTCDKPVTHDDLDCLMSSFYQALFRESDYLMQQIDNLHSLLWNHTQDGHLPKIHGAEKMQKALEKLGIDGDYQVQKSVVWAKDQRGNNVAVVEFVKKTEEKK